MFLALALLLTPPPPTQIVVEGGFLLGCHRSDVGVFTGPACLKASSGATVQNRKGQRMTLERVAKSASEGCVGLPVVAPDTSGGLWYSPGLKPVKCAVPSRESRGKITVKPKERARLLAALKGDVSAHPYRWKGHDDPMRVPIQFDGFSVTERVRIQEATFLSLAHITQGDFAGLTAVVRLGKAGTDRVIAVSTEGVMGIQKDACIDLDGDGQAEILIWDGGETSRTWSFLRFIDGYPEPISAYWCGD